MGRGDGRGAEAWAKVRLCLALAGVIVLAGASSAAAGGTKIVTNTSGLTITEGASKTVQLHLDAPIICPQQSPTCDVTLTFTSPDPSHITIGSGNVTWNANEWAQTRTMTVTAVDDGVTTADMNFTLSATAVSDSAYYSGYQVNIPVTVHQQRATLPATLSHPQANATYGLIPVGFTLGENPLNGSMMLTFSGSTTIAITLTMASPPAGPYDFTLNPKNILSVGAPVTSTTSNTIPDGTYTVTLSYQDVFGDPVYATSATNVTIDSSLVDVDGDGVTDAVEDAGPNSGDANGDGTQDSQQANVLSYVNPLTHQYAVLETDCTSISAFQIGGEAAQPTADPGYDYPMGLAAFHLQCLNPGDTATIRQYYYGVTGSSAYSVRKWMNDGSYKAIPGSQPLGTIVGGQLVFLVEYQITDGGEFDNDGVADGVIVDPSGAAVLAAHTTSSAGGGTLANTGSNTYVLIISSVTTIIGGLVLIARRLSHTRS